MLLQNMKQRVVLRRSERELQCISNKKWHHGTTAAPLTFQVANIWNRHVVGEIQGFKPLRIPVEDSGTEPRCMVFPCVSIDSLGALQEYLPIAEQEAIVVQVVNVYFKSAVPNAAEEVRRHWILSFGY